MNNLTIFKFAAAFALVAAILFGVYEVLSNAFETMDGYFPPQQ